MAKRSPELPITGTERMSLVRSTTRFADILEENCQDSLYKVMLYCYGDGEIKMVVLLSDEDGRLLNVYFQMNVKELVLRVSKKFKSVGRLDKAVLTIEEELIKYIHCLEDFGKPVATVFFDVGQRFTKVTYAPDPKEEGSFRIFLRSYEKDEYGLSEASTF